MYYWIYIYCIIIMFPDFGSVMMGWMGLEVGWQWGRLDERWQKQPQRHCLE